MLADQNLKEAAGPGGQSGTSVQSSAADLTPDIEAAPTWHKHGLVVP